jgi:hypothetical protein
MHQCGSNGYLTVVPYVGMDGLSAASAPCCAAISRLIFMARALLCPRYREFSPDLGETTLHDKQHETHGDIVPYFTVYAVLMMSNIAVLGPVGMQAPP